MLSLHRASRATDLVDALAQVLSVPPDDPLVQDVVSVPTRGVERWLSQTLASRLGGCDGGDGVCANIVFPFPGSLVNDVLARATGITPDCDPWIPERLVWPLIDIADEHLAEPWLSTLARHVGHGVHGESHPDRRARRFATLRHIADLYDRYAVHRPDMLDAWARDEDVDGNGSWLGDDVVWQARLWRILRRQIATPSPGERLTGACQSLREDPTLAGLPERLALFGLTRLPAMHLRVLDAIAQTRDVHLFLLHPSPVLWQQIADLRPCTSALPRRRDPTTDMAENALLGSWGRDAREMQLTVAGTAARDVLHADGTVSPTLLGRIQDDVRNNREPDPDGPLYRLDENDRSVQIHSCHGRTRQVEVTRDAVLHLMADDPTLEPRDVLVMCPDVEEFASLVHATFGAARFGDSNGIPDVRVRLADRSLRQTNPVLGVIATLLELVPSRVTASQVLDLAATEPVARRFDLDDEDVQRMTSWVREAGVRWGMDGAGRADYGLDAVEANTWRFGLDRLLAGVAAVDDGDTVAGVLPLDDVSSNSIDLAGRVSEFVTRLGYVLGALRGPHAVVDWCKALANAAQLLTDVPGNLAWQQRELDELLAEVIEQVPDGRGPILQVAEITALLADRLRGHPTRANFRTGSLTVCTLVPMRSVPHRVVCVMGLDDGAFPRRGHMDGDDILLRDPRVGDSDVRGEDRQLLLDALMAAEEHLVIVHTGADERTNQPIPAAVPVLELCDVIDRTAIASDGTPASEAITTRHPLQPFAPRNFIAHSLGRPGPWGFDHALADGATALLGPRMTAPPFLDRPLDLPLRELIEVESLVRFLGNPMRAFFAQSLGVHLEDRREKTGDSVPVDLDGLQKWSVKNRVLAARLRGTSIEAAITTERYRGHLPPGDLADSTCVSVAEEVEAIIAAFGELASVPIQTAQVEVPLGEGRTLVGTVPGIRATVICDVNPSRIKPKRMLAAWAYLVALTAHDPSTGWSALVVGDSGERWELLPLGETPDARATRALDALRSLVDLYDRGLCEPLPIFEKTSAALARGDRLGAQKSWTSGFHAGEDQAPEAVRVFGRALSFDELCAIPVAPADALQSEGLSGGLAEHLARRLWLDLNAHAPSGGT